MPVDVTDRSRRMERSKRTAWGSCGALIVQRGTPLTSDKKKKKKKKKKNFVMKEYLAGGGGAQDMTISIIQY